MKRKRKGPLKVTINDPRDLWSGGPFLKDFDREMRKEFRENQWKPWLNKWILIQDAKGQRLKIRLIQKKDGELCPQIEKNRGRLINFYSGILFNVLKERIRKEGRES